MGTKNATSSGTSNGTSTTTLSPQVQAAYNALLGQLGGASTGTNSATTGASTGLGALAANSNSNPAYTGAAATLSSAAAPASASIGNYLSPYLSDALQTQIASQNQQDLQQQQGVVGNAAAQGALGGNRVGVAQGQLAGQQAIANNAANSSLVNSAYQQAENAALAGQQNETAVGSAQTGLGSSTNASTLSDLLGQLSAGNSQFSNLGTLAGSASSLSNTGATTSTTGTTSQTQPSGNFLSSLLGAGLGIAGLFKSGGVVPHYDAGGEVDQMAAERAAAIQAALQAATPQNDNQANDDAPLGNLASPAQMKAGVSNIGGWLSGIGLASGGTVARGYDDGGYVRFNGGNDFVDRGAIFNPDLYDTSPVQSGSLPDVGAPPPAASPAQPVYVTPPVAEAPQDVTAVVPPMPVAASPSAVPVMPMPASSRPVAVAAAPDPVPLAPLPSAQILSLPGVVPASPTTALAAVNQAAPLTVATNNPGAITDGAWARSMPGYAGSKGDFAVFDSPQSGQAAQLHLLSNYVASGHNTIASVISKWAPPAANAPESTANYIAYVSGKTGLDPNAPIPPDRLTDVANAQAQWESGLKSGGFTAPSGGVVPASILPSGAPQSSGVITAPWGRPVRRLAAFLAASG